MVPKILQINEFQRRKFIIFYLLFLNFLKGNLTQFGKIKPMYVHIYYSSNDQNYIKQKKRFNNWFILFDKILHLQPVDSAPWSSKIVDNIAVIPRSKSAYPTE